MSPTPPPIILIVLDTVGAKHLSLYGYSRPTTPHLEQIARECTVYRRCFAPGCWTVPCHGSLFTGLYPSQHGAAELSFMLRDNLPHLVPILKAHGYYTMGISSNSLVSPATGLCQDFDEFHDLGGGKLVGLLGHQEPPEEEGQENDLARRWRQAVSASEMLKAAWTQARQLRELPRLLRRTLRLARRWAAKTFRPSPLDNATPYTRKTLRLLRRFFSRPGWGETPFFLFVNCLQAHHDYRPPIWRRRFSRWHERATVSPLRFYRRQPSPALDRLVARYTDLYDDEISYLDHTLGRVWAMLRRYPWFEDAMVIITSDHGEHLGEKGHFTHILSLYNELLWVPLIIRYPRGLAAPGVDDRLASLTDVYATILDVVDCPLPRPDSSLSLLGPPGRETVVAQILRPEMWRVSLRNLEANRRERGEDFSPPQFALITASGRKLISRRDGGLEVYDLQADMEETRDLAPGLPGEVLDTYNDLLNFWKIDTGFAEAVAAPLAAAHEPSAHP
jgi:arylsulfatase A-like enzyme